MSDEKTVEAARRLRMTDEEKLIEIQTKHIEQLEARIKELEEQIEDVGYEFKEMMERLDS